MDWLNNSCMDLAGGRKSLKWWTANCAYLQLCTFFHILYVGSKPEASTCRAELDVTHVTRMCEFSYEKFGQISQNSLSPIKKIKKKHHELIDFKVPRSCSCTTPPHHYHSTAMLYSGYKVHLLKYLTFIKHGQKAELSGATKTVYSDWSHILLVKPRRRKVWKALLFIHSMIWTVRF